MASPDAKMFSFNARQTADLNNSSNSSNLQIFIGGEVSDRTTGSTHTVGSLLTLSANYIDQVPEKAERGSVITQSEDNLHSKRRTRASGPLDLVRLPNSGIGVEKQNHDNLFSLTPVSSSSKVASFPASTTPPVLTPKKPNNTSHLNIQSSTAPLSSLNMSSQRSRAPRNGSRGDSQDGINKKELWDDVKRLLSTLKAGEKEANQHFEKIFANEEKLNTKKNTPEGLTIADIDEASSLWREGVKMAENQKQRINDELRTRIELLRDTQRIKEKEQEKANDEGSITGRASSSRTSGMEFDGPSDSPVPSPAENRQVRKIGASRTSSQPPRGLGDKDNTPSEASERASKPKVVYHQGQEVAFKRKVPNGKTEEQDWIQGRVVRVIGEGKSRRYEVKDPYPDENSGGPNVYKSSASQMVPIPPEGATLGDYEPGRMVLALYPETTTFYRAEVKAMLDGGKKVQLLFEGETDAQLNEQDRRFVLDHKG